MQVRVLTTGLPGYSQCCGFLMTKSESDHGVVILKQNGKGNWRWTQGTERSRKSHRHTKRASLLAEFGMKRNTLGLLSVTSINKGQDQAVSRWPLEKRVWHNGYGAWVSEGTELKTMEMIAHDRKNLTRQLPHAQGCRGSSLGKKPGFSGERLGVSGALSTMEWDSWGHRGKT